MARATFDLGDLSPVTVRPDGDRWTLTFVRELRHPPEKVWAALTEPDHLREWAPFVPSRDLSAIGAADLTMIDGAERVDLSERVIHSEPPKYLEYTLGDDVLSWELAESGSGTRLTLRHTTSDRSQSPMYAAGWHICLVVAERLLDGRPVGPIVGENARNYGWDDLYSAYADVLEIPVQTPWSFGQRSQ